MMAANYCDASEMRVCCLLFRQPVQRVFASGMGQLAIKPASAAAAVRKPADRYPACELGHLWDTEEFPAGPGPAHQQPEWHHTSQLGVHDQPDLLVPCEQPGHLRCSAVWHGVPQHAADIHWWVHTGCPMSSCAWCLLCCSGSDSNTRQYLWLGRNQQQLLAWLHQRHILLCFCMHEGLASQAGHEASHKAPW